MTGVLLALAIERFELIGLGVIGIIGLVYLGIVTLIILWAFKKNRKRSKQ
jgi:hypothetical protein